MQPLVRLKQIGKDYGGVPAVRPLDLDVAYGDFCAILGPSGCGKSTLLRMIAGFVEPTSGRVEIDGVDVTEAGPERRPTNMVFQGYGLFPHLSVAENVGFGLAIRKTPRVEIAERVGAALSLVRLDGFGERRIDKLSGGQQQRVALARALILRPKVLLLDEPLAALDLQLRHVMQDELRRIHREIGGTFIFVTHDQTEAFALATRVVVMNEGRIEQAGPPAAIYLQPASLFVANFVGETNVLRGRRRDGRIELQAGPSFEAPGPDGEVSVIVRPENVVRGEGRELRVRARVADVVFLGNALKVATILASGETLVARDADVGDASGIEAGQEVTLSWSAADCRVLEGAA